MSDHDQRDLRKLLVAERNLEQLTGREPSVSEIAACCAFSIAKVEFLLELDARRNSTSFDIKPDEEHPYEDSPNAAALLGHQGSISDDGNDADDIDAIKSMVAEFPDREREIFEMRFGLRDGEPLTIVQIAKLIEPDITTARIGQLIKEMIKTLRRKLDCEI